MTHNVFGGTLNLTPSINQSCKFHKIEHIWHRPLTLRAKINRAQVCDPLGVVHSCMMTAVVAVVRGCCSLLQNETIYTKEK